nr:restriction endonuclease subunit S [uncultured Moellerella sp.]
MSSDWQTISLIKLVSIKGGKRLPKGSLLQTKPNSHPYIRVRDMGRRYIPNLNLEYVPDNIFPKIQNYIVNENDVIISIVGTIGLISIIDMQFNLASQTENAAKLSGLDKNDAHYLYYYLISKIGQIEIQKGIVGAVQPKLPLYNIEKIQIIWPNKPCRINIVNILKKIDDKIELNHQINQTLEQIAQALFKSWFVDFDPVKTKIAILEAGGSEAEATLAAMTAISGKNRDSLAVFKSDHPEKYAELKATAELFPSAMQESELGEIPVGWAIGKLGQILTFNPKRVLKKGSIAPYLDMKNVPTVGHSAQVIIEREFSSGSKFNNGDTLLARITPCLENGKTAYVDFLLTDALTGWGSTEFIVIRSNNNLPLSLSYFFARLDVFRTIAIQSMQGTSGRQRADASVLENHTWIIPQQEILQKFGIFGNSILKGNKSRHFENNSLTQLRDTLLPKLLSGEITLPDAEKEVSEAFHV